MFIVGEVQSRSALLEALPKRTAGLATELAGIQAALERFTAESGRGSGLATQGLAAVCAGLSQGAVETLIISDIGDATVVADADLTVTAADPAALSEYGAAPVHTLHADGALP